MRDKFKTIQKCLVAILLLTISVTGFYACKKQEALDPNARYKRELKTYHESQDYKNLQLKFPKQIFIDLPIFDVNSKMKTIVTNIISNSGEIVRAMTYFEPEDGFNTWYPTLVISIKAEKDKDLKDMVEKKMLSASIEIKSTKDQIISSAELKNNIVVNEVKLTQTLSGLLSENKNSTSNSKIASAAGGVGECLSAVRSCITEELKDMGWVAYAACLLNPTPCIGIIAADCLLHEKECIGVPKNF